MTPRDLRACRCFLFYFNLLYMMLALWPGGEASSMPSSADLTFAYTYLSHRAF